MNINKSLQFTLISVVLIGTANAQITTATATAHLRVEGGGGIALKAEPMGPISAGQTSAGTPVAKFVVANTGDTPFKAGIIFAKTSPCPSNNVCFVSDGGTNYITLKPDLSSGADEFWKETLANGVTSAKELAAKTSAPTVVLAVKDDQNILPGDYTLTATAGILTQ